MTRPKRGDMHREIRTVGNWQILTQYRVLSADGGTLVLQPLSEHVHRIGINSARPSRRRLDGGPFTIETRSI